jgi:CBS domain-containing protein
MRWSAGRARHAFADIGLDDGATELVVIDDAGHFVGFVSAGALAEAPPTVDVGALATLPAYTADAATSLEDLAIAIDRYHLDAVPVLSGHGRPIGIISAPAVLAAILGVRADSDPGAAPAR